MKRKTTICIVMTLLMVVSTISLGTVNAEPDQTENLTVEKYVYDGEGWVETLDADFGDILAFKIVIDYDESCGTIMTNIVVKDTLPMYLEYVPDSSTCNLVPSNFTDSYHGGNQVYWNLTEDYGLNIDANQTIIITYNVEVTGYGEFENFAEVFALETCCQRESYNNDYVTVIVERPPPLIFEKEVKNETGEWTDLHTGVTLGEIIDFKLTITYNGYEDIEIMKCAIIEDYLPSCCLEYVEGSTVFTYPNEHFEDPEIIVSPDGKYIKYDWTTDKLFNLYAGETLVIEFQAEVVDYCYDIVENCAFLYLWSCMVPDEECFHLEAFDCAAVDCNPPDITFEKHVLDGEEWVKEIDTMKGSVIRFKLEFEYYGVETLSNIVITDELPCILEYKELISSNVNITVELSDDGKTIWFNTTPEVEITDGEKIVIIFDADVTGTTSGGCCEEEYVINYAWIIGYVECQVPAEFFPMDSEVHITALGNCPPSKPEISAPATGEAGESITFTVTSEDSDLDKIAYKLKVEGGAETEWTVFYNSSAVAEIDLTFSEAGIYTIQAMSKDEHGFSYGWTTIGVTINITEAETTRNLKISIPKMIHFNQVQATIKNTGDFDETNIYWEFTMEKIGKNNGSITNTLQPGKSGNIHSKLVKTKFGLVNYEIKAYLEGETDPTATKTGKALLLGRIIITP